MTGRIRSHAILRYSKGNAEHNFFDSFWLAYTLLATSHSDNKLKVLATAARLDISE